MGNLMMTRRLPMLLGALIAGLLMISPVAAQGIINAEMFDSDIIKAARAGDDAALRVALLEGNSPNDRANSDAPAILVAAENRRLSTLRILAEAGARVDNQSRRDRRTALTVAAELGEPAIVRALLEFGADPDYPGSARETAIIKAARNGHAEVIEVLIEGGAYVDETDLTGQTALEIAENNHHQQAADALRAAGAY